jgi:hypothetical protein
MLPIIVLTILAIAPLAITFGLLIADDISRAKQARNFARMMNDPRVIAAHRAAEQCKTKAKA